MKKIMIIVVFLTGCSTADNQGLQNEKKDECIFIDENQSFIDDAAALSNLIKGIENNLKERESLGNYGILKNGNNYSIDNEMIKEERVDIKDGRIYYIFEVSQNLDNGAAEVEYYAVDAYDGRVYVIKANTYNEILIK